MKMTMFVDEALLTRVMNAAGIDNKTKAIDLALRELDRRNDLKRLAEAGLGMSAAELREAFEPATPVDTFTPTTATDVHKPRTR